LKLSAGPAPRMGKIIPTKLPLTGTDHYQERNATDPLVEGIASDTRLAVAMTHNRMFRATTPEENPFVPIGEAVRKALGVSG